MDDAEKLIEDVRVEEQGRGLVDQVDLAREEIRDLTRRLELGEIDRSQHDEAVAAAGLRIVESLDRLDDLNRPQGDDAPSAEESPVLAPEPSGAPRTPQDGPEAFRAFLEGGGLRETLDDLSGVVQKVGGPMILALVGAGLAVLATAVASRSDPKS